MSKSPLGARKPSDDRVLEAVADPTRRAVLSILRERSTPVPVEELATTVAAALEDVPLVDVTREARKRIRVGLRNLHLPKLEDAGLVEWDREAGLATTADHPAISDPRVERLLSVDTDDWDAVLASLSSGRRRLALSVLESTEGPLDRATLARRVVAREHDVAPTEVPAREIEEALVSLHHVHFPKLQQAGLVAYDEETACYIGHPELDAEWLALRPEPLADPDPDSDSDSGGAGSSDVWTIAGRADVIARGQALIDEAEEELFVMITTDGLLEDECVRKLRAALDRGVDVYVGSQTTAVRDLVRERLPRATIWEPQLNWLNLAPNQNRLGRLVFADREAIMLGTLGDAADGPTRETALTGEGPDNSLVILLRELLGSRLDHLDRQSEDGLSQLPL